MKRFVHNFTLFCHLIIKNIHINRITHLPNSQIKIDQKFITGEPNTKIFCTKYDYEDKYLACACEIGEVRVYNVNNGKLAYTIPSTTPNVPFSYVRWRPNNSVNKPRNVFVTVNADGQIQHWHLTSGSLLFILVKV